MPTKPRQRRITSVLADSNLRDELIGLADRREIPKAEAFSVDTSNLKTMLEDRSIDPGKFDSRQFSEAIILEAGRPALLVRNDKIEVPVTDFWRRHLAPNMPQLTRAIQAVGRIELFDHPDFAWVGTGWMIDEDILVTNRHVAEEFVTRRGTRFFFRDNLEGKPIRANIDFKEEYKNNASHEIAVEKILYVAERADHIPDVAFLQVSAEVKLPSPLQLAPGPILTDRLIGVVGYPARDGRNDSNAMSKVFGDIYNVKRFSPGKITDASTKDWFFDHDCSTLGGNSGSAVIELETGHAVGLHFSGGYRHSNYAVRADALEKLLAKLGRRTKTRRAPARLLPAGIQEKQQPISAYAQKEGYDHSFLGSTFKLPLPKVKDHDAVLVLDSGETELRYTHFSVVMHVARRLPILTAVNVHGGERRFVSRKGTTWYFDPRLPREAQVGSEFYGPTDFDRGHMVRREDPIWGEGDKIARLANEDTFHYTNACPQHPDLNQRSWLELENFILDTTDVRDLLVSVFTGPVLSKEDPEIAGVQVPVQFWKVVAVIDDNTDALAVTGYMQSQEALVSTMEYRFGAMKTYQVPLRRIERLTGLDFGRKMRAADALEGRETTESLGAGEGSIEIRTPADIRLP